MIIPIRCMTCGKVMADKYDWYVQEVLKLQKANEESKPKPKAKKEKKGDAANEEKYGGEIPNTFENLRTGPILDKLGLTRICCRRHMLTTVDMMEMI